MLSLRMLARALPKASFGQSSLRCASSLARYTVRRPVWQSTTKVSYPAFSTCVARREPAGDSDQELSAKLANEHSLELANSEDDKAATIQEYLENSPFQVQDQPGTQEVVLTRDFGNEKIKIEFSIADINEIEADEYDAMDEDGALEDEADYQQPKTINQSGTKGGKIDVMPEDSIAPSDREGDEGAGGEAYPAYPIHLVITVTKPGKKAIEIRAVAQDGAIEIENINYFPKASLLEAQSPKDAQEARALYGGPPVGNLDPELQMMLERYLEERGINAELAAFLPDYVDFKEQREYVQWLENVKNFVDE